MSGAEPLGVILAGGRATRMGGGDKGLLPLGEGTILGQVVARLAPQVAAMAISANGDPARFARFGLPVLPDPLPGFPGPLAG
ncbi:MAG: NTP transferase domain-containing protein, partial [Roseovarius sp.]|nr:NTP transferase domain-containing protein [Roseovarius sp.]